MSIFSRLRVLVSVVVFIALGCSPLAAHPLGNFTINHLTKLRVGAHVIGVHYVLDMAEIPTYQALREVSPTGTLDPAQLQRYGAAQAAALVPQLRLWVNGGSARVKLDGSRAQLRPGAGGLPTFYLVVDARALLGARTQPHTVVYRDATFAGRLGWHDVVVLPRTEPTRELTAYPSALLGSPRATTGVDVGVAPDGRTTVRAEDVQNAPQSGGVPSLGRTNQLSDMISKGTSDWRFVVITFLVAIVLGALHALEPGHGKTLLAVSLVGARATVKQAGILAGSLTIAHTIGVLALGVAISLFKGVFVPETIYPWITLLSGIAIAVIGARAVGKQLQARRRPALAHAAVALSEPGHHAHAHAHGHAHDHGHAHPHDHDHGHAHSHVHGDGHAHAHSADEVEHARSHAIPGHAPLTFGGTVWAAMSGGVAPCPAALVVLLAAIALNEVEYGVFVIIAFSFGLAATLTGLGIAVVRGAGWLQRRPQFDRLVRYGPLASAIVISTIGAIMVGQGFAQQGVSISPIAITAAVALFIAAYAVSSPLLRREAKPA